MEESYRASAERMRSIIARGRHDPTAFRFALRDVPPRVRDAWVDAVLGLDAIPDDGPELPRGCVPYFPCPVDALLRLVDRAPVHASDVFVDLGAGIGRAATLVHLLTGAEGVGVEIQPTLVDEARALAARLSLSRIAWVEGDATQPLRSLASGTVFFLYCPFGGERLDRVLFHLEDLARTRTVCIGCVDLPLPPRPWLAMDPDPQGDLTLYRSTFTRGT